MCAEMTPPREMLQRRLGEIPPDPGVGYLRGDAEVVSGEVPTD